MIDPTPAPAQTPALADEPVSAGLTDNGPRDGENLDTCEARLKAWAEWFGLDPAPVKRGRGKHHKSVLMSHELVDWMHRSGGSFDWFVTGDVRGMAATFRKSALMEQQFVGAIKQLDDKEMDLLKGTMLLMVRREIAAEDVVEAFKAGQAELHARRAVQDQPARVAEEA